MWFTSSGKLDFVYNENAYVVNTKHNLLKEMTDLYIDGNVHVFIAVVPKITYQPLIYYKEKCKKQRCECSVSQCFPKSISILGLTFVWNRFFVNEKPPDWSHMGIDLIYSAGMSKESWFSRGNRG